uniref:Integrator complex subunit 12 n=1 Tax=Paramormyrops kingsleyae TaxID=1676925 RepID=A0A3B3SNM7_9TELE
MAATVNLELDPIFLKGLGYLHSKSKDSAEKLKALLDESLARGSDSSYRISQKDMEIAKVSVAKVSLSKQDLKSSSAGSSSIGSSSKSSSSEKSKKESEKRASEKMKVDLIDTADPPKKPRLERVENRASPVTVQTSKDLPVPDLSSFDETSADDFAMEMGLACVVCRQMTVTSGNQLVECQECHNLYHQDCHKPQVTDKDVNDPRLVWYCARCTRQMKRMAQKTQKPPQKPAPAIASAAPVVKDTLVKRPDVKPKQDTASTFQAFKRTEVKASAVVSVAPSSTSTSLPAASGLSGWAAFGAKAGPGGSKLGSSAQSGSGKAASSGQKPVGLSSLAGAKSGLGAKMAGGGNGSSATPLKPPPPLTLGKPGLTRGSVTESNKVGSLGSSSAAPTGEAAGSGGAGGSGPKVTTESQAGGKAPTSQESQFTEHQRL